MSTARRDQPGPSAWLYRLPLSRLLPVALLLFTALAGVGVWLAEAHLTTAQVRERAHERATQTLHLLQHNIESELRRGHPEGVAFELGLMASRHDVDYAWVADGRGRVLAATERAWVGRPVAEIAHERRLYRAGEPLAGTGEVLFVPGHHALVGRYPVVVERSPTELRPRRDGVLYVRFDFGRAMADAQASVSRGAWLFAALLFIAALPLWAFLHVGFARRVERLQAASRRIANGGFEARAELEGGDELARLSQAFDTMAASVQRLLRARAVAAGVNQSIVHTDDAEALFGAACEVFHDKGDFPLAALATAGPPATVSWRAGFELDPDGMETELLQSVKDGKSATGGVVSTLGTHPAPWARNAAAAGAEAALLQPLQAGGKAWGALLLAGHGAQFNADFLALAEELANDLGFALQAQAAIRRRDEAEAQLRASEARYHRLYDGAPTGYASVNAVSGRLTQLNPAFAALFGASVETLEGRPVLELYADGPHGRERAEHLFARFRRGEPLRDEQLQIRRTDGSTGWVLLSAEPVYDEEGRLLESRSSLVDITRRVEDETALARTNRALGTLSQCNQALIHADSVEQLLQGVCGILVHRGGYRMAWVGVAADDPQRRVKVAAQAGKRAEEYLAGADVRWGEDPRGVGPTGTAIRSARPQLVRHTDSDPSYAPWRERAEAFGFSSVLSLPLGREAPALGALVIHADEANAFDSDERELLEELADDLAYGISVLRTRRERDSARHALEHVLLQTIQAISLTLEKRDPYTAGHQQRVAELATAIGRELGLEPDRIEGLRLGAGIHDIGKLAVPTELLNRPGKLGDAEFEIIKRHPQVGYEIVAGIEFPWPVAKMIHQHHERVDGSGYPLGLRGNEILLEARIIAVADVVEAMMSHRPYRPGHGLEAALEEIAQESGSHFDGHVVEACRRLFREERFQWQSAPGLAGRAP